nr:hypothetical protein [Tanacetum cinerariifolium]
SIPSEDPYEEATQQLLEQAPCSPEYVPNPIELEDHVPAYIPEHPEDLVPTEDEAPIEAYIPEMRAAVPSTYHSLLPSETSPLLPIPLPIPSTSCRAEISKADTLPRKRLLLTAPRPVCEVGESSAAAATRQPGPTMARSVDCSFVDTMETRFRDTKRRMMTALEMVNIRVSYQVDVRSRESLEFYSRHHDAQKDRAAVRAEIEVLRRERLAYEQESIQTRKALARYKAYSRALEARVAVLETQARRHDRSYMVELPCEDCYSGSCSGIAMENLKENNDRQELALMCDRMFPEESDRVEKYINGLPDMIHDSMKVTMPKTMQEAIEFATELMNKRICNVVENKWKFKGTFGNNQNQPHQNKRQNTSRAYAAGNSDRNIYTGDVLMNRIYYLRISSTKFFSSGITLSQQWQLIFIGSGKLLYQWELFTGSGNALCILFLTILP